jgi:YegS/Rv2252/BmrU family lipid kinase
MASEDASSGGPARRGEPAVVPDRGAERVAPDTVAGRPLALLVNPTSAGGRTLKLLPRVETVLDARRVVFRVRRTKGLEDAAAAALRAVDAGEVPVVMGGDGLVGAVGGAMAGAETPLGIVPGGRGNDLCRVLGIPTEPEAAIATVLDGEARRIDVGEANGERFLGIASCGFDSDANRIANETHLLRGNLVYAYAALRALAGWRAARFHIVAGSERLRVTGWSVIVANSKAYGGGMFIAPDAELDDGRFDVVTIGETGKLNFLRNLPKVFKGTHIDNDEVTVFRAARLDLSASRPFAVYADGEHLTDLPATLRVLPRALSVLVPRAAA